MAKTLGDLAKTMEVYATRVERNVPLVIQLVVKSLTPTLVYSTPVDTSRARVNWQAGINSVPGGTLFGKPDKPPSPDYGARTAIDAILATADTYAGGGYIAIANNLPYIQKLNDGYSAQAPAAFVQLAVATGIRSLRGVRILRNGN